MTKLFLKVKAGPGFEKKMDEIGKIVTDKMKFLLKGNVGHETKMADDIKYRLDKNKVIIYTDNKILEYLEYGTKPHIIRPKDPHGALAFQAQHSGKRKSGKKYSFGDEIVTKVVHHPGFDKKPFFNPGFLLSKNDIKKILKSK